MVREGEERKMLLLFSFGSLPPLCNLIFLGGNFLSLFFSVVFPGPSSLSYHGLEVKSPIFAKLKAKPDLVLFVFLFFGIYFDVAGEKHPS